MTEVTLTSVFRKSKETKYGIKPQISIKTDIHGDKWLSSFNTRGTEDWKPGDIVQINVIEQGDFLNFKPVVNGGGGTVNPNLEARVTRLERAVFPKEDEVVENIIEAGDDELSDDGF